MFVRPETPLVERLRGAEGAVPLPPRQSLLLLFCLSKDREPEVSSRALATLSSLPDERFTALADWHDLHPSLLHTVAQTAGRRPAVRTLLYAHPCLAGATRTLLDGFEAASDLSDTSDLSEAEEEREKEYASKYQQAQAMGIAEKIKMALTGDKEWRTILVKDANKLVSSGVLKNPRLTEPEVLAILKSSVQNDEIIRIICANKEWVKNYQIRKALLENPKTPLSNALRFLGTMNEKDVAGYAKSRNISSVISTQAKRMLLARNT